MKNKRLYRKQVFRIKIGKYRLVLLRYEWIPEIDSELTKSVKRAARELSKIAKLGTITLPKGKKKNG